ncbi:TlpA disulfide reductase family protein [Rhodocytophaga aerolata]|uniref:TlpA disulfide reductase family protein n=1 Tax=Rhodocytophaga aerolata TaxID=455078 RepID=A0ABT8R6X4_9BACT|nr:TlpA disulfide reductase family protein [Rhodocytophaga aerolata]MDO1447854.1 TlpA disulfide reductase family protein [Rhodocytophaga aerolata]
MKTTVFQGILLLLLVITVVSCTPSESAASLTTGQWRGVLTLPEQALPFTFEVEKKAEGSFRMYLINAGERLELDSILIKGDSIYIPMHIFDAQIAGKFTDTTIQGAWIKNYAQNYHIPFRAAHGQEYRFETNDKQPAANITGKYAIRFADRPDSLISIGVFEQQGAKLTGTVLTRTGDYRYLDGVVAGHEMKLSTFDGEHAYVLTATIQGDSLVNGKFWSGKAKGRSWSARKDANAALPDPSSLTFLKDGHSTIDFSFPGSDEDTIRLSDAKYQGKVVILQLFGTWCPNCMDETRFLAPWYEKNKDRGVEIIGLAYEKKPELEYARKRVQQMKQRLNVGYDFAIAGTSDTESASKSLPMLNQVISFPTTIFIDKTGKVRKIHTGFSGPGTGNYYEAFVEEFNLFMDKLLSEESKAM